MIIFGLVANIDEELNGLWLRYRTSAAFDRSPGKCFISSCRAVAKAVYLLGRERRQTDRDGGKTSETTEEKRRTEGTNNEEKWEKNAAMRIRGGLLDRQGELILSSYHSLSSVSSDTYDTCCEAQISPQICTETDTSHCGSFRNHAWE